MKTFLTKILNTHSEVMRVTGFSKRWWNKDIAEIRKIWASQS